ncbi:hypothetical protein BT96DRAFT_979277 [Gymnopus androsaceus JB14]|uniref:Uncharacterized protein n=1 Tax=Gymnopus androsaceus JB14 TaxID=1447944 RepID=A0A6A4H5T1_9AGAR|nr:hypothetical protein BT96DRAFT_979277 [Gymnopus androsaceus JB14]
MPQTLRVPLLTLTLTRFIIVLILSFLVNGVIIVYHSGDHNNDHISSWPTWKIVVVSVVVGLFLITLIVLIVLRRRQLHTRFLNRSRNTAPTSTSVPLIAPSPPTYSIGYPNHTVYDEYSAPPGSFVPMKGDHVNDGGRHYPPVSMLIMLSFFLFFLSSVLVSHSHRAHHQVQDMTFEAMYRELE